MGALPLRKPHTPADFQIHCEQYPNEKFELIDGEIIGMAGASRNHNKITHNFSREMGIHLKDTICVPYTSDLYVKIGENRYLPDVVIDCETDNERDATRPILIIEVASQSTRNVDFYHKLADYTTIPSLQEYAIVEQDVPRVYLYRKKDNWQGEIFNQGMIYFESIDFSMSIDEIYHRVIFTKK